MVNQTSSLAVQSTREETPQMRLISLNSDKAWAFIPGQVAVLGMPEAGESFFAIASAPEDKGAMEFLVRKGGGVSQALFEARPGTSVQARGPVGKGFPIDQYQGRDFLLACVGSALAPMRSVLRSISYRRAAFGRILFIYGVRYPVDFALLSEIEGWKQSGIEVILTVSRPQGLPWNGKTGYVQSHFEEAVKGLRRPVALICGMKAMMEEGRNELVRLGVTPSDILTNY